MDRWMREGDDVDRREQRSVEVSELTPEEAAAVFDRIVRSALNLSGEQFLADFDAGKFDDVEPDAHPGLLDVLMALPLVR
jgi:hypothetical protein